MVCERVKSTYYKEYSCVCDDIYVRFNMFFLFDNTAWMTNLKILMKLFKLGGPSKLHSAESLEGTSHFAFSQKRK